MELETHLLEASSLKLLWKKILKQLFKLESTYPPKLFKDQVALSLKKILLTQKPNEKARFNLYFLNLQS